MTRAIIIEATPGRRRLDPRASRPRSLIPVVGGELSPLEWTVRALRSDGISDITYVGGYHIEKVIEAFPELSFRYLRGRVAEDRLRGWMLGGEEDCLFVNAATLLKPGAVVAMRGEGCRRGVYGGGRPAGVHALDAAGLESLFAGGGEPVRTLRALAAGLERLDARPVDLSGLAAPAADKAGVAAVVLTGKARTLDGLTPMVKTARVLALERFPVAAWGARRVEILDRLRRRFAGRSVVVRSSTLSEDNFAASGAGRYLSVLDVAADDALALAGAVDRVVESFGLGKRRVLPGDEVLVQPFVGDLAACGVLLTRDPQHGSPYFVLNVDSRSGRSDVVTSGGAGKIDTAYFSWSGENRTGLERAAARVLDLARELMRLSCFDSLDIEFGIDGAGTCYLFQVRPLACVEPLSVDDDDDMLDVIGHLHDFAVEAAAPAPGVLGRDNVFSNMSDWNPAEMIGACPRPLALSLYQTLIGDRAWASARARLGYRDLGTTPLILSFGGRAYVDVRASLNSFLPAGFDESAGARWVESCLDRLRADPPLHDKIEFDLTATCMTPDWGRVSAWLDAAGFSALERKDFACRLSRMTADMVLGRVEPIAAQAAAGTALTLRRERILAAHAPNLAGYGRCLRPLTLDCIELGVVPFSIVARYAFVAMSLLKGLRAVGAIGSDLYDAFLLAVPTVSGEMSRDAERLARGQTTLAEMTARYGHLRPSSYDIVSRNYAACPERYFRAERVAAASPSGAADPVALLQPSAAGIERALAAVGIEVETPVLARFMAEAIAGRERLKFEFMKNVDAILETVAAVGEVLGLTRDELSFVPIGEFLGLERDSASQALESHLRRVSGQNEKRWLLAQGLRLPDLIAAPDEVFAHRLEAWRPNFVTRRKVTAKPVVVGGAGGEEDLSGALVFIRAADPGFDWIFGHAIAGLVTQYGGVASHMAIRAAEFGLPAAIGCGEALFETLSRAARVELDCELGRIRGVG
jgi:phosphohistidine swiveling domain-containing protein